MRRSDEVIAGVAGDAGVQIDAQRIEQRLDLPKFAGEIIFAENIDAVGRHRLRLVRADHVVEQRLPSQLVAEVFRTHETRCVHRNAGRAELLAGMAADGIDIVTDQRGHTGGVDEHGGRAVFGDRFLDGAIQPLLARTHDDIHLRHVGGEAGPVERGAGAGGMAVVPTIALTGERAVHEMDHIGDRLQRDLRAVKRATTGSGPRGERLGTAFLTGRFRLGDVLVAGGLVENFGDLGLQILAHHACPSGRRTPTRSGCPGPAIGQRVRSKE